MSYIFDTDDAVDVVIMVIEVFSFCSLNGVVTLEDTDEAISDALSS